jgi:hypothetical protein
MTKIEQAHGFRFALEESVVPGSVPSPKFGK